MGRPKFSKNKSSFAHNTDPGVDYGSEGEIADQDAMDIQAQPLVELTGRAAIVLSHFSFAVRNSPNLPAITQTFKKGIVLNNRGLIRDMLACNKPIRVTE